MEVAETAFQAGGRPETKLGSLSSWTPTSAFCPGQGKVAFNGTQKVSSKSRSYIDCRVPLSFLALWAYQDLASRSSYKEQ